MIKIVEISSCGEEDRDGGSDSCGGYEKEWKI